MRGSTCSGLKQGWLRGQRGRALWRRWCAAQHGQAMAEYAIMIAAVTGALVGLGVLIVPNFMQAFQSYLGSYYQALASPWP